MPFDVQMGHNFKASDSTDFQASAQYGSDLTVHNAVNHKLNDNLAVKLHQHFVKGEVTVGIEAAYTL